MAWGLAVLTAPLSPLWGQDGAKPAAQSKPTGRDSTPAIPPCVLLPLDTIGFGTTPARARVCLRPGLGATAIQIIDAKATDTLLVWLRDPGGRLLRLAGEPQRKAREEIPMLLLQRGRPPAAVPLGDPVRRAIRLQHASPSPTTRAWTAEADLPWRLDSVRLGAQHWAAPSAPDPCVARLPVTWRQANAPVRGRLCLDTSGALEAEIVVREPLTAAGAPDRPASSCGQLGVCLQITLSQGATVWPQWRAAFDLASRQPRWLRQQASGTPWVLDTAGPPPRTVFAFTGQVVDSLPGWRIMIRSLGTWRVRAIGFTGTGKVTPEQWAVPAGPRPTPSGGARSEETASDSRNALALIVSAAQPLGGTGDRWGRAAWGVEGRTQIGATQMQATLRPAPVVQPLLPLMADPNRRLPRLLPEGRPELRELQQGPGSYLWMDTWRIDQTGAVVRVQETANRWQGVGTLDGEGALSMAAGAFTSGRLRIRGGAMRTRDGVDVGAQQYPWASVFSMEGGLGASWEADTSRGEVVRDTGQVLVRPLPSSGRARAAWTHSGRLGRLSEGRSTVRLEAEQPIATLLSVGVQHEVLPSGLSEAGAVRAPWEGLALTEAIVRRPPAALATSSLQALGWDLRLQIVEPWRGTQPWDHVAAAGGEQHLLLGTTYRREGQRVRLQGGLDRFQWPGLTTPWRPQVMLEGEHRAGQAWEGIWRVRMDRHPLFLSRIADGRTAALRGGLRWGTATATQLFQLLVLMEGGRSWGCGPGGSSALRWTGADSGWVGNPPSSALATASSSCRLIASTAGIQTAVRWLTPHLQLQLDGVLVGDRPLEGLGGGVGAGALVALQGPQLRGSIGWRSPWGVWQVEGSCWQTGLGVERGCGTATMLRVPLSRRGGAA